MGLVYLFDKLSDIYPSLKASPLPFQMVIDDHPKFINNLRDGFQNFNKNLFFG